MASAPPSAPMLAAAISGEMNTHPRPAAALATMSQLSPPASPPISRPRMVEAYKRVAFQCRPDASSTPSASDLSRKRSRHLISYSIRLLINFLYMTTIR